MSSFPIYSALPQRRRRPRPQPTIVSVPVPVPSVPALPKNNGNGKTVQKRKNGNTNNNNKIKNIKNKVSFSIVSYFNFVCNTLSNIWVLSFYIAAIVLIYNYTSDPDASFITKFVTKIVTAFKGLEPYKCTILWFILAYTPFAPVLFAVRDNRRVVCALALYAYIIIIPERTVFEYLAQSLVLVLIVKSKDKNFRLTSIILFVGIYLCQFALPTGSVVNSHDCVGHLFTHSEHTNHASKSAHIVSHSPSSTAHRAVPSPHTKTTTAKSTTVG
uniref:Hypothetical non-conserved protein n=1 Tax=Glossina morsitans morsitans TaxID=37546 RepID=D3TSC1_GLOMM